MLRATTLVLALLFSFAAPARELKLATWNLGWLTLRVAGDPELPSGVHLYDAGDLSRLHEYASKLRADVVAIQGVDGEAAGATVFDPAEYDVLLTGDEVVLRSGFAVRRGLRATLNADIEPLERHRLRSGADVTVELGPATTLRLLSVHLKAGCRVLPIDGPDACATLREQGRVVRDWIDQRASEGVPYAVMGDFGRVLDAAGDIDVLLGPGAPPLLRATEGRANPCWGGGAFTDHLLFGGAARVWVVANTLRAMVFAETNENARAHLPAHCPVSVRLRIPD